MSDSSFDVSNTASVSLSRRAEVNEIVFNPGASAYTVTATTRSGLTLSGVGVTNNSGGRLTKPGRSAASSN
jgi:hypothetical protein